MNYEEEALKADKIYAEALKADNYVIYEKASWELFRESYKYKDEPYIPPRKTRADLSPPRKFKNEYEMDAYMWETYCEFHQGSKKVELINKSLELLRLRNECVEKVRS